ncbi:MAG: hypothetical protein JKX97_04765 [Candidatus Lindowbacteria bacterium]|nr:hypothetical protein [Candidatus Lindowbacteria bacterium]
MILFFRSSQNFHCLPLLRKLLRREKQKTEPILLILQSNIDFEDQKDYSNIINQTSGDVIWYNADGFSRENLEKELGDIVKENLGDISKVIIPINNVHGLGYLELVEFCDRHGLSCVTFHHQISGFSEITLSEFKARIEEVKKIKNTNVAKKKAELPTLLVRYRSRHQD